MYDNVSTQSPSYYIVKTDEVYNTEVLMLFLLFCLIKWGGQNRFKSTSTTEITVMLNQNLPQTVATKDEIL